jgi:hypothetical protein
MKHLLLILAFACSLNSFAQKDYTVDGKTYSLAIEVDGALTLLWNTIDGEYRYFSKKGNDIVELTNTREGKTYQQEYKQVLLLHTSDSPMSVDNVKLTLSSLREFYNEYNQKYDPNFSGGTVTVALKTRLAFFAGMTNYVYFANPDNTLLPQLGVDFEIIDEVKLRRHSIVFQFRQILSTSDFDLSSSQFSLNYRFKFVKSQTVDIFINTKIAGYSHFSQNIPDPNGDGNTDDAISGSGGEFQAPFAFGLGADIALGNGFITVGYYDIVALNLNDNGDFPVDFIVGYKLNL